MTRLRLMRYERGLKVADVARGAGVDPSYLSKVERGKVTVSPAAAKALADFYEVDVAEILGVTTEPEREAA